MKLNHQKPELTLVDRKGNPVDFPFGDIRDESRYQVIIAQPGAGQTGESRGDWLAKNNLADTDTQM